MFLVLFEGFVKAGAGYARVPFERNVEYLGTEMVLEELSVYAIFKQILFIH